MRRRCRFLPAKHSALYFVFATTYLASCAVAAFGSEEKEKQAAKAKQLVQEALQSEVSGNPESRNELLRLASTISPNEPSAHWQLGRIQSGAKWHSYDELVEKAKNSKVLENYRMLRDDSKPTLESQHELIQYCKKYGLKEQALSHWSAIAELDPENVEAKQQLGFERVDGQWIDRRELAAQREKAKRLSDLLGKKLPELQKLSSDLASDKVDKQEAIDELLKEKIVDSIPIWESVLSTAHTKGAAVVVEVLKHSEAPESTKSLARHAIWADDPWVRKEAISSLRMRDEHAYVPSMLAELQGPWFADRQWMFDRNNRLICRYSVISDGKDKQTLKVLDQSYFLSGNRSMATVEATGRAWITNSQREFMRRMTNQKIQAHNDRIIVTLKEITGETELTTPQDCWEWWDDKNEVYSTSEKPLLASYAYSNVSVVGRTPEPLLDRYVPPPRERRSEPQRKECLAGGTPILTQRGPVAIERIRIGDLVLAKHFETGEVRFQPVLRTTTRAPEPLVRITLEKNNNGTQQIIRASGGHPFWVSGKGWVRARELTPGSRLHGLEKCVEIQDVAVEEKATKTYNLVVSEFHSYFVGSEAVLSHDNSIVSPIPSVVPGLSLN